MNDVQEVKKETEQVSLMQKYQPTSDLGLLEIFKKLK